MLAPEVEALPWPKQLALDDASYRAQLAYLFERSAFYRTKLAAAGVSGALLIGWERYPIETTVALPVTGRS